MAEQPTQAGYPVTQTTVFPSKVTAQYAYPFNQSILQYLQPNIATVPHVSALRPQTLLPTSQSPPQPQRTANFPLQGQPISTPSPLSQQTVVQDTYRPLMQPGTLYSAQTFPSNQYIISTVRPTAQQPYQATINSEVSNSVYTMRPTKAQAPGTAYEQAVPPPVQPVYLPVEQQYLGHPQTPRQSALGFYADSNSQSLAAGISHVPAGISHVPAGVPFAQVDKRLQQLGRDNRSTQHEQQVYSAQGHSEMVKHVHAKPFQPPATSPPTNMTHQMVPGNRHMTAAAGPTSISSAYQLNSAVISIPAGAVQGNSTSTTPSETSSVITQAHTIPVSRLGFHQFAGTTLGSYQRPMAVQSMAPQSFPGMTYRAPVVSYQTSNVNVNNQTGMIVQQKPYPVVRQVMAPGRATPGPHRMPAPIQRPNKPGLLPGNPKEKLASQPPRPKSAQSFNRRGGINQIRGAVPSTVIQQQLQQPPHQHQQQQMFRSQQHQLMLNNVQQFFAEDKEIEMQHHHRKHGQEQLKRGALMTTISTSDNNQFNEQVNQEKRKQPVKNQPETRGDSKPQKPTKKDEQKKSSDYKNEKRTRPQDRKDVRTAQIQPQRNQARAQNRPRASAPKQETKSNEKLPAVEAARTEQKSVEKIESRVELKEPKPEVVSTPLVS